MNVNTRQQPMCIYVLFLPSQLGEMQKAQHYRPIQIVKELKKNARGTGGMGESYPLS
jgi:hypothetical protein